MQNVECRMSNNNLFLSYYSFQIDNDNDYDWEVNIIHENP